MEVLITYYTPCFVRSRSRRELAGVGVRWALDFPLPKIPPVVKTSDFYSYVLQFISSFIIVIKFKILLWVGWVSLSLGVCVLLALNFFLGKESGFL